MIVFLNVKKVILQAKLCKKFLLIYRPVAMR